MRRIKIEVHPLSVALGIVCALAVSFAVRPVQTLGGASATVHRVAIAGPVSIDGAYGPRMAVVVQEGTPYTVPTGKLLVMTALGRTDGIGGAVAKLIINGIQAVGTFQGNASTNPTDSTVRPLPFGLTATAGSVIEVTGGLSIGRAWGYLVDA